MNDTTRTDPSSAPAPAETRDLWLVRHGETEGLSSIRLYGRTDIPLSDAGREMMRRAARALDSTPIRRVFSSRLSRSRESAEIVARVVGAEVHAVAEFDEVDFGEWEGLTVEEARRSRPDLRRRWEDADAAFRYPGGESIEDFHARVAAGLRRILAEHPDGDLALVLHKGVIKAVLMTLMGIAFHPVSRMFEVDLGSISRVRLGDRFPRIVSWNAVPC
jgi:broad specificity phosphatase PhoE